MSKKYLRTEPGERIDQPDLDFAANESQRRGTDDIGSQVLIGTDSPLASYVLSGFEPTDNGGTLVTVTGGVAITQYRERGVLYSGAVLSGGDASRSVDIAGYGNGTYFIYVRLEFLDSDFTNRIKWNPLAVTPVETIENIATRKSESWSIAIEVAAPGEEWLLVGEAVKAGAVVTVTDTRTFYFEGASTLLHNPATDWGTGTDRDDDRAQYGVFGLRRFVRAIQSVIVNITGETNGKWWRAVWGSSAGSNGARSLTSLNDEKLSRSGTQTVTGALGPNADQTIDLGSSGVRWRDIFCQDVNAIGDVTIGDDLIATGDLSATNLILTGGASIGTDLLVSNDLVVNNDTLVSGVLTVDGPATVVGLVTGLRVRILETATTSPAIDTIYTGSFIKAWAIVVTTSGAAGIDTGLSRYMGCSAVVDGNNDLEFTLVNAMDGLYGIKANPMYPSGFSPVAISTVYTGHQCQTGATDSTTVIVARYTDAGAPVLMNGSTFDTVTYFEVTGECA